MRPLTKLAVLAGLLFWNHTAFAQNPGHAVKLLAVVSVNPEAQGTQNPHNVVLTWVLSSDDTTTACAAPNTCLQNTYRATGACSATSAFSIVSSPAATATTLTDTNVSVGQTYCYQVTFEINGLESPPSNQVSAVIRPFAPTSLGRQAN